MPPPCCKALSRIGAAFSLMLACLHPLFSQPSLTVEPDRASLSLNETLTLTYQLKGTQDVGSFIPPDFFGFTLLRGPETRMGLATGPAGKVPFVTISFVLKPERSGTLLIEPAHASMGSQSVLSSPSVYIQVTGAPSATGDRSRQGAVDATLDPATMERMRKGIFIRLETDRTEVYVGEPLVATYKLYTRLNSESRVVRRPTFAGFSVLEVERSDSSKPVDETFDGQVFQTYVLRKVQLIPLRQGSYELEPVVVDNLVELKPDPSGSEASGIAGLLSRLYPDRGVDSDAKKVELTIESPRRTIRVKPLPGGAPSDFTGAVGRFRLSVGIETDTVSRNEVSRYTMVLEGTGNLILAGNPIVDWPASFEVFDPEIEEDMDPSRSPLSGTRKVIVPFSIGDTGVHTIPSPSMSAFDPASGLYYGLSAGPVRLMVSGAPIPSIVAPSSSSRKRWLDDLASHWLLTVSVLALVAFVIFIASRRGGARPSASSVDAVNDSVTRARFVETPLDAGLNSAERLLSQGRLEECCREIERVLSSMAAHRYGVNPSAGLDVFLEGLRRKGVGEAASKEWVELVRTCQVQAFSPNADPQTVAALLEGSRRLLDAA